MKKGNRSHSRPSSGQSSFSILEEEGSSVGRPRQTGDKDEPSFSASYSSVVIPDDDAIEEDSSSDSSGWSFEPSSLSTSEKPMEKSSRNIPVTPPNSLQSKLPMFPPYATHGNTRRGGIQLITGPMFSGKSDELIRRMKRYRIANRRCFLLRPHTDTRTPDDFVYTHGGDIKLECDGAFFTLKDFIELRFSDGWDVIGIDEGQFFPDLVEGCREMANSGCQVIVAACDATDKGLPFGPTIWLVLEAERVDKLRAVCEVCYSEDAAFSILRDTAQKEPGQEVLVGGKELYYAACRACRPGTYGLGNTLGTRPEPGHPVTSTPRSTSDGMAITPRTESTIVPMDQSSPIRSRARNFSTPTKSPHSRKVQYQVGSPYDTMGAKNRSNSMDFPLYVPGSSPIPPPILNDSQEDW